MDWAKAALWVPVVAVASLAVLACIGAALLPASPGRRRIGLCVAVLCGAIAVGATVWARDAQQRRIAAIAAEAAAQRAEVARQRTELAFAVAGFAALGRRLATLGRELPPAPGHAKSHPSATVSGGIAAVGAAIDALDRQIAAFRIAARGRTIDDATAAAMAAFLRPLGPHRVVVSCAPDDAEAYDYANRIATVLRQAGWPAVGPETTAIFGTAAAMAVALYVRPDQPPAAARALIAAFARFNIPYQSRIPPTQAMPDPDTIELFVARKR